MMVVIKTGMSELPQVCEECRYYSVRPHPYDGWMDMCELCGEKLDCRGGGWDYDGNKRADNCPLMEVPNDKMNKEKLIEDFGKIEEMLKGEKQ